jgi:hypothetical protein
MAVPSASGKVGPPVRRINCKYCGSEMVKREPCPKCGWQRGLLLVDGKFEPETPPDMLRTQTVLAVISGIVLFIIGAANGASAGIVFGLLFFLAGIATLTITQFGKVWVGLEPGERTMAWSGRIAGSCVLAFYLLVLGAFVLVGKIFGR